MASSVEGANRVDLWQKLTDRSDLTFWSSISLFKSPLPPAPLTPSLILILTTLTLPHHCLNLLFSRIPLPYKSLDR